MHYRVNLPGVFWYRKAHMVGNKVFEAASIFRSRSPPADASSGNPQISSQVSNSILDVWEKRMKKIYSTGRDHKATHHPSPRTANCTTFGDSKKQGSHEASGPGDLPSKNPHTGRRWGLFSPKSDSSTGSSDRATFLLSDSGAGTSTTTTTQGKPLWPQRESEHADEPSNSRWNLYTDRR